MITRISSPTWITKLTKLNGILKYKQERQKEKRKEKRAGGHGLQCNNIEGNIITRYTSPNTVV